MQLKSISKFSYLEINGSKSSFRHINMAFLMLISESVVAVKKNLCNSLLPESLNADTTFVCLET